MSTAQLPVGEKKSIRLYLQRSWTAEPGVGVHLVFAGTSRGAQKNRIITSSLYRRAVPFCKPKTVHEFTEMGYPARRTENPTPTKALSLRSTTSLARARHPHVKSRSAAYPICNQKIHTTRLPNNFANAGTTSKDQKTSTLSVHRVEKKRPNGLPLPCPISVMLQFSCPCFALAASRCLHVE